MRSASGTHLNINVDIVRYPESPPTYEEAMQSNPTGGVENLVSTCLMLQGYIQPADLWLLKYLQCILIWLECISHRSYFHVSPWLSIKVEIESFGHNIFYAEEATFNCYTAVLLRENVPCTVVYLTCGTHNRTVMSEIRNSPWVTLNMSCFPYTLLQTTTRRKCLLS